MNVILVKIFATALALSQITTRPDNVKTHFDPTRDQSEVVQLLQSGCAHIRKVFEIEDINLDDLITTAMDDPQAISGGIKMLHDLKFEDLFKAYRQFCKNEKIEESPIDLAEVISFYDKALADLPDHSKLKQAKLSGVSAVLDGKGERFSDLGDPSQRRIWMPLERIPQRLQNAFIAAEDKRFYQHKGVDERGMIRAFVGNMAQPGRPQGGSTITQQVIKNLLVGEDVTYERKIREIIVASRAEQTLSKSEILALYLNSIYLGRGAWGVEMAANNYFGKTVSDLSLSEAALLAGLTKGPNYYNPVRHPDRARERLGYVLTRLQEDGAVTSSEAQQAQAQFPRLVAYARPRRDTGYHFADQVAREAKSVGVDPTGAQTIVRSTVHPQMQRITESALQEGLARYEMRTGRVNFQGAETNLSDIIRRLEAEPSSGSAWPIWRQALEAAQLPLYDVHWSPAVIVSVPAGKSSEFRVGLADGRLVPLSSVGSQARRMLKLYDVVFVAVADTKSKSGRAELRVRPTVQGAAVVLENKTGRILAMAGGFSYPLSQLNRVSQARRQPGSTLKPITYLAALQAGLQPNTLVLNEPITLPPINSSAIVRDQDYWSPKNYDGGESGALTLRRALENSKNLVTAHLLNGGISATAEGSLDRVCEIAMAAQLYK
ncbi:MAG TPA: transglycosylase domain-containing protein, partial [Xanthobacteraceae bacterium]|nr:transglycosylase domain-containing protein [Xanthobacteraceae bacterium]